MDDSDEQPLIKPVPKDVAHRICTGQVVLSLSGACKELIENSMDAGATNIEIRLKGHGSEVLEVCDDASGIRSAQFDSLCKAHRTSKLRTFDDLSNMETFGFRGEALNALCALSNVTITSRHATEQLAHRLEFDRNGNIKGRTPCSRQTGTTVHIERLFEPLPVRRKELLNNIKREFSRLISVVQSFALIAVNVRFNCHHTLADGKKHSLLVTSGNKTLRDNITAIFGPTQSAAMIKVNQQKPSSELCSDYRITEDEVEKEMLNIDGFISSCQRSAGRSNTDRQFVFINRRPCDYPKICKVVNDVYRQYNHLYPVFVLNIEVARNSVDVNVTPDKRRVFLSQERVLLATIHSSIKYTLDAVAGSCPTVPVGKLPPVTNSAMMPASSEPTVASKKTRSKTCDKSQPNLEQFRFSPIVTFHEPQAKRVRSEDDQNRKSEEIYSKTLPKNSNFSLFPSSTGPFIQNTNENESIPSRSRDYREKSPINLQGVIERTTKSNLFDLPPGFDLDEIRLTPSPVIEHSNSKINLEEEVAESSKANGQILFQPEVDASSHDVQIEPSNSKINLEEEHMAKSSKASDQILFQPEADVAESSHGVQIEHSGVVRHRVSRKVKFSLSKLKLRLKTIEKSQESGLVESGKQFESRLEETESRVVEAELTRLLKKSDFGRMEICGQFNVGFIIGRLDYDLFIIDQHASDEKHTFEELKARATVKTQKLLLPKPLELSSLDETILLDNMDIFIRNGFQFQIINDNNPGQRAFLTAVPAINKFNFDKSDVEELIAFLAEFPGVMHRPSRIRRIFASSACRRSVMIGTALNRQEMTKIVRNLGTLEHPWNCPHGRPTLRHLTGLPSIEK